MTDWGSLGQQIRDGLSDSKIRPHNIKSAIRLLEQACGALYEGDLQKLIVASRTYNENKQFSTELKKCAKAFGWNRATSLKVVCALKAVLRFKQLDANFVSSIFIDKDTVDDNDGKDSLDDDDYREARQITRGLVSPNNKENPDFLILRNWIEIIRGHSKNQSPQTLRKILSFYVIHVLPLLNIRGVGEVVSLNSDVLKQHMTTEIIFDLCKDPAVNQKLVWLKLFISRIVEVNEKDIILKEVNDRLITRKQDFLKNAVPESHDFISMKELTAIHNVLGPYPMFKTMFIIILTTGLRIGSMVTMLLDDVLDDEITCIKKMCRVKCKGRGKSTVPVQFPVRAKEVLLGWISSSRPASSSPYVFPSKTGPGHVHPDTIRKQFKAIAASINLPKEVCHPHALRHTFAHNSLTHGATLSAISCQMHHKSTKTTSEFYLKEDAKYVSAMLHNVFMDCDDVEQAPPLPSWLVGNKNVAKRAKKVALAESGVNEEKRKIKQFKSVHR